MVGSAIVGALQKQGETNIVTRTHAELDLTNQAVAQQFFAQEKPTQVYLATAKVGGIHANNTYPADFIYQNLMVQSNVVFVFHKQLRLPGQEALNAIHPQPPNHQLIKVALRA